MNAEFVDTNILVYAFGDDPAKRAVASSLISRLDAEACGVLSTQNLVEFCSVATRKLNTSTRVTSGILESFARWEVFRPRVADIARALELKDRYRISFWDAMIVNSAIELGARILWTEDLNHGQRFGNLIVRNPFTEGSES